MKLSISSLISSIQYIISTYPLLFLSSVALMLMGLDMVWGREILSASMSQDKHIALIGLCCISLLIGTGIYSSFKGLNLIAHIVSILGLAVWWFTFPDDMAYSHTTIITILGVATISFLVWGALEYRTSDTKTIHIRIAHIVYGLALGMLVTIVLAGGLSAALGAVQALFDISISPERYATIWIIISTLVGVTISIENILRQQPQTLSPARRQSTIAWVISVLIVIFGVILYTYLGKIIITRSRPSNQVTLWSLIFVSLVLIGRIMIVPLLDYDAIRKDSLHLWAHYIILPILIIATLAVYRRIAQYGITVPRYLVSALILVLIGVSLRHIITRRTSPYPLFVAISLVGLIAIFGGPISARSVAYHSQVSRLTDYLSEQGLYEDDQLDLPLSLSDTQKSVIGPLVRHIYRDIGRNLQELDPQLADAPDAFEVMDVENYRNPYYIDSVERAYLNKEYTLTQDISGYNTLHNDIYYHRGGGGSTDNYSITIENSHVTITIIATGDTYTFDLSHLQADPNKEIMSHDAATIETENAMLILSSIGFLRIDNQRKIDHFNATLLTQ